ncbi:MAG: DUF1206 domain-containing protein [Novosphingobium sp.]|nr:DUF1206 domain-containing protein [Novosphingobium sp.]
MARMTRLDWIAKAGYVARGLVYILFGWLALSARRNAEEGKEGVFDAIREMPLGEILLPLTALGLLAYGVYRLTCAFLDTEGKGTEPKGLAGRAAQFFSGVVHLALAYTATQFIGDGEPEPASADGEQTREATRTLLDFELGDAGLWIVALAFFAGAGWQLYRAFRDKHMKHLEPHTPPFTKTIGKIGVATRGIVFAVIGWSFIRVAETDDPGQAKAMGSAVASLYETGWLYTFVAIGLILFGVFSLIQAKYRIVPAVDVAGAARDGAMAAESKVASKF